jgi:hypothetical protein
MVIRHFSRTIDGYLTAGLLLFHLIGACFFTEVFAQENNPIEVSIIQESLVNCYSWSNIIMEIRNNGYDRIVCNASLSYRGLYIYNDTFLNMKINPFSNKSLELKVKASEEVLNTDYIEKGNLQISISYAVYKMQYIEMFICPNFTYTSTYFYRNVTEIHYFNQTMTINIARVSVELNLNSSLLYLNIRNFESTPPELFRTYICLENCGLQIDLLTNQTSIPLERFMEKIENCTHQIGNFTLNLLGGYRGEGNFSISRLYKFRSEKSGLSYRHTLPYVVFVDEKALNSSSLHLSDAFYLEFTMGETRILILLQDLFVPSYRYINMRARSLLQNDGEIVYLEREEFIGPILGGLGLSPFIIFAAFKIIVKGISLKRKPPISPPSHIDVG